MTDVIKPTKKSRDDGKVEYWTSDDARFLVMRGDYTADEIIDAAVTQDVIDAEMITVWVYQHYYQCWYKASPIGPDGYNSWNYPRNTPCRGAYFASVIQWD